MADKQISDLTSASAMTDGSLFVIEQGGAAKSANWGMIKNYISPGVAAQYSSSATYNVGDYVIYNEQLYRCTTAITTAESWTAAHWIPANVSDAVFGLSKAVSSGGDKVNGGSISNSFVKGYYYTTPASGSAVSYDTYSPYATCIIPVAEGDRILVKASAGNGITRLYVFIDSSGNAIGRCSTNLSGVRILEAPSGAVALAVNNNIVTNPTDYYVVSGNWERNLYDYTKVEQGTYDSTNGESANSFSYCRTPLYKITDIDEAVLPASEARFVYRYDSSKAYIDRVSNATREVLSNESLVNNYGGGSVEYIAFSISISSVTTPADVISAGFKIASFNNSVITDRVNDLETLTQVGLVKKEQDMYMFADYEQGGLNASGEEGTSYYYCRTGYIDIGNIDSIYKPLGVFLVACMYDANKAFLDRITNMVDTSELTLNANDIANKFGYSGQTKYLRFSAERIESDTDIESLPSDIVNSGLKINVVGASEDIYEQILNLKEQLGSYGNGVLPSYYDTYIENKINGINALEDSVSVNSDSFIFITDYHYTKNAQNSPILIHKIVEETGISKLFFGGDAGVSAPLASMYRAARNNGKIYQKLWESAPQFYGMLGNHEWNDYQDATHEASQQPEVYSRSGVVNFYLNKEEQIVNGMSVEGNYYVDNARAKIRYFVLQGTGQAKISNDTAKWLGDKLGEVPSGWYVVVFNHYAYTGGTTGTSSMTGRGNLSVLRIAQLLGALKNHSTVTINQYSNTGETTGTFSFDYTNMSATPIGIISGHTHWDASLTTSQSTYGILTVATTCDAFGYAQNAETHASEPRQVGTIYEQAFDVVQIDIDARKLYMTRIGGGADREFTF